MLIYNASDRDVHTKAYGNHFTIKAGQIKMFTNEVGDFLIQKRAEEGLVELPDTFEDPSYRETEEGKAALIEKKAQGIDNRVKYLMFRINNLRVSLKQDLEQANIKVDPLIYASKGDEEAMKELSGYQKSSQDEEHAKLQRLKVLEHNLRK